MYLNAAGFSDSFFSASVTSQIESIGVGGQKGGGGGRVGRKLKLG